MSRTNSPSNKEKEDFFNAVEGGKIDKVQDMLSSNSRLLNIVNQYGNTPLIVAVKNRHERIVKLLIRAGADINKVKDEGWTPLLYAASDGHDRIVKLLLDSGANPNKATDEGWTPLIIAAAAEMTGFGGHDASVKLLLEAGADPNKEDGDGWTPLSIAIKYGRYKTLKLLLDAGADIYDGELLGFAEVMGNDEEIIKMIVEHILFSSAMNIILVADKKGMKIYDAFEVYLKVVKKNLKVAGLEEDLESKEDLERLRELYNVKLNRKALWNVFEKAMNKTYGRTNSRTNSSSSTRFGKGNSKKPQKRPSSAVCARAQKLGIRLTLKRNNKRVYKSEEMLRAQIKNAVTKQNKRKSKQSKK
jgi:hypothetical protein